MSLNSRGENLKYLNIMLKIAALKLSQCYKKYTNSEVS